MHTFRPHIHFAPKANWINDPNGLVYFEGEYHLFFQHYPHDTKWGPMHWGHAVSTDLIHWEELDIALEPEGDVMIFSGSAVIDYNNTAGFGYNANGEPPMIAIYTSHSHWKIDEKWHALETQSIAYSHDRGRTFTKYSGNPVLTYEDSKDFRDPKVCWYEEGHYWIMTVVAFDHVRFYKSTNLKEWELLSTFGQGHGAHDGVWECPDLIRMGDKWVLLISLVAGGPSGGSATQYFVGDFDGTTFTNDNPAEEVRWIDYGADNYAGVTYNNTPDGRIIFIGWMNNWKYGRVTPSVGFRGTMTIPRELRLENGRIIQRTIRELRTIKQPFTRSKYAVSFPSEGAYRVRLKGRESSEWHIRIEHGEDEETVITFNPQAGTVRFDRSLSGIVDFHPDFATVHEVPYQPQADGIVRVKLIIDVSSIEILINNGKTVITNQIFPTRFKHLFVRDGIQVDKLSLSKYVKMT